MIDELRQIVNQFIYLLCVSKENPMLQKKIFFVMIFKEIKIRSFRGPRQSQNKIKIF